MNTKLTCCRIEDMILEKKIDLYTFWHFFLTDRAKRCLAIGTEQSCSHSSLFHCSRSMRCISYHRLVDDFQDCYFNEDELYPSCQLNDSHRFICELDHKKCLSPVAISNLLYECSNFEDELSISELTYKSQPPFSRFCDGFLEMIDTNETDDTSCELWPCDNPYTHCDGNWNCPNGTDELNCSHKMYSSNEYQSTPIRYVPSYNDFCIKSIHLFDKYIDHCNEPNIIRHVYFK
ncbi:unnamed protein product [Rotaria sp. Silwood2]|nr:unnamed protein product [Rotaria sp. Silwood2]